MNSDTSPSHGPPATTLQQEWRQQVDAWQELLVQCARKPSRRRVHFLRSLTLRLRVALEYRLEQQRQDSVAHSTMRRWIREGKKLRRALEPIRDADVQLARMTSLRTALIAAAETSPPSARCLRQMDKLAVELKRKRDDGVAGVKTLLAARSKRLRRVAAEMEAALAPGVPARAASPAHAAQQLFSGLCAEVPALDAVNLHAFRKRLKPALYLAQFSAATDPAAARLAFVCKKMQSAAGEWHDWQALALEARRILPHRRKQGDLVPILERQADASLERALTRCRRAAARFLRSAANDGVQIQPSRRKKPVAMASIPDGAGADSEMQLAG
jgi:hypothetical protein